MKKSKKIVDLLKQDENFSRKYIDFIPDSEEFTFPAFASENNRVCKTEYGLGWHPFMFEDELYLIMGRTTAFKLVFMCRRNRTQDDLEEIYESILKCQKKLYSNPAIGAEGQGLTDKMFEELPLFLKYCPKDYMLSEPVETIEKDPYLMYVEKSGRKKKYTYGLAQFGLRPVVHLPLETRINIDGKEDGSLYNPYKLTLDSRSDTVFGKSNINLAGNEHFTEEPKNLFDLLRENEEFCEYEVEYIPDGKAIWLERELEKGSDIAYVSPSFTNIWKPFIYESELYIISENSELGLSLKGAQSAKLECEKIQLFAELESNNSIGAKGLVLTEEMFLDLPDKLKRTGHSYAIGCKIVHIREDEFHDRYYLPYVNEKGIYCLYEGLLSSRNFFRKEDFIPRCEGVRFVVHLPLSTKVQEKWPKRFIIVGT